MTEIGHLERMRVYFNSGATRSFTFRREQLKKLRDIIIRNEEAIYQAVYSDLKKSKEECWVTENGMVLSELNQAIRHLHRWMRPHRVSTNLVNLPSGSRLLSEPLGVVLIIGPWNYPFQLLINPLIGAIAAGNCVVLKPSEHAPATAEIMKTMIEQVFPPEYILYADGEGAKVIPPMMEQFRFDHVFYTGSTSVGRLIYKMAADKLVPCTLELGGKSPCVVEEDANLKVAARRIAMTKYSNAGQMCVAPDYILVNKNVKDAFIQEMIQTIKQFFGENADQSYNYGRMINRAQFDRVSGYLSQGRIVYGGNIKADQLYIEPTILTDIVPGGTVMNDEIFGPVLPVIGFSDMEEAMALINRHPDPLAFYVYTSSREKENAWLDAVPSGGACVNNSSWHLTNHNLPFGGRGNSGIGLYHGRYSYETFSHKKAVMKTPSWFDPALKYPPFKGKLKIFKWVIR
jgi:aldehyde dehydrogenase (NAD+)